MIRQLFVFDIILKNLSAHSCNDHHHAHLVNCVRKEDKINYQLAWTIVLIRSLVWLGIKRDVGKACLQILGLLGESVLSNRLERYVNVDAFLSRCFKIWNIIFRLTPLLGAFCWYLKAWLISKQSANRYNVGLTARFSKSILLPRTTKGKCSGFLGLAWIKNSSRQESRFLNVFGAVVSNTRTQQSAPR